MVFSIEDIIIDEADKWIKKVEEEIKVLKEVTNVDELPSELRYLYEKFQSSPIAEDFVRFMTEHTQTEVSKGGSRYIICHSRFELLISA